MKETLAAALVQLSFYRKDRMLVDPCCGSGTIPIEAALIARNIAPGINRKFAFEDWDIIPQQIRKEEKKAAFEAADFDSELSITGMDIDRNAVRAAVSNSDEAGAIDDIDFACVDFTDWMPGEGIPKGASRDGYGVVISNLPYGIRIGDRKANQKIYEHFGRLINECPNWSFFLITSDKEFEKEIQKMTGRRADRRRKLYNGTIETQFYQYHGARPPRADTDRS
jgi:putative N6-adenine-specific DNA methylase